MIPTKKIVSIFLVALLLAGALSGCGRQSETEDERLVVSASVCAPLDSLDPAQNTDAGAETVFYAIYENLLRAALDGEGNPTVEPAVARAYEVNENYDGTLDYVFHLRSSARWSDGTRVKAKDFVFAWRRLVNPATASPNAAMLSMVQGYDAARESGDATQLGVYADSDSVFRVTLAAPCAYFLSDVCTAVATMPLRGDVPGRNPDWASSSAVPCNGPFQISVWVKTNSLYLRRNEKYYEKNAVAADTLRFLFAQDAPQAAQYYEEGAVDYAALPALDAEGASYLPLRSTACVFYNHMSEVFSNAHMRRAFDLALDRAAVSAAAGAAASPATGLVPHGVINVPDGGADFRTVGGALTASDADGYALRCVEAMNELRLSGFWGGVEMPALTCLYVMDDGTFPLTLTAVELWREKLGVTISIEGLSREAFDLRVAAGDYDLAIDTIRVDCGDAMCFLEPFAGLDADNPLHYVSKPYDLLIGVARTSRDAAARAAMLHDAESLLLEDAALSPVCFNGMGCLQREELAGIVHDSHGNAYFSAAARAGGA